MDPFHASIGSFDRHGVTMTQKEVEALRMKRGLCPTCERQLFKVEFVVRKVPLNIPGKVRNGHCLRCDRAEGDGGGHHGGGGGGGSGRGGQSHRRQDSGHSHHSSHGHSHRGGGQHHHRQDSESSSRSNQSHSPGFMRSMRKGRGHRNRPGAQAAAAAAPSSVATAASARQQQHDDGGLTSSLVSAASTLPSSVTTSTTSGGSGASASNNHQNQSMGASLGSSFGISSLDFGGVSSLGIGGSGSGGGGQGDSSSTFASSGLTASGLNSLTSSALFDQQVAASNMCASFSFDSQVSDVDLGRFERETSGSSSEQQQRAPTPPPPPPPPQIRRETQQQQQPQQQQQQPNLAPKSRSPFRIRGHRPHNSTGDISAPPMTRLSTIVSQSDQERSDSSLTDGGRKPPLLRQSGTSRGEGSFMELVDDLGEDLHSFNDGRGGGGSDSGGSSVAAMPDEKKFDDDDDEVENLLQAVEQCGSFSDVPFLVCMMKENSTSSRIQEVSCRKMRNLSLTVVNSGGLVGAEVVSGWIDVIADSMKTHPAEAGVQAEGCGTLWWLSAQSDANRAAIGASEGLIGMIIGAAERFGGGGDDGSRVLPWALGALCSLSRHEANLAAVLGGNGIAAIVSAAASGAARTGGDLAVWEDACRAMHSLSTLSDEAAAAFVAGGGMEAILDGAGARVGDARAQRWACAALWSMLAAEASAGEQKETEGEPFVPPRAGDIMDVVVAAMERHPADATTQEAGCAVLSNVICDATYGMSVVRASPVAEAVSNAISSHSGSATGDRVREYGSLALFNLCDVVVDNTGRQSSDVHVQVLGCRALSSVARRFDVHSLAPSVDAVGTLVGMVDGHAGTTVVREAAFDALDAVCCGGDSASSVVAAGGAGAIVRGMLKESSSSGVQEAGCLLLSKLSAGGEGISAIREADGAAALTKAMHNYFEKAALQRNAILALRNMFTSHSEETPALAAKALPNIIRAMQGHPHEKELQEDACGALWCAFASGMVDIEPMVVTGAMQAIVRAMEKHPDAEILQREACGFLWHFSTAEANCNAVVDINGIEALLETMSNHRTAELHERACGVLSNLSSHDFLLKARIIQAGGIDALISSMLDFPQSRMVQLAACATLCNLAVDSDALLTIGSQGGSPVLVNTIKLHSEVTEIRENACCVLFQLISEGQDCFISVDDGIMLIIKEMKANPESFRIQETGLIALVTFCLKDKVAKQQIASSGGIEVVVRCMRGHLPSAHLQQQACVALWSFAMSPEHQHTILHAGGIFSILNAMLAWILVEAVQVKACGALMTLASDPEIRAVIRASDGVAIVIHSMRANYQSAKVQQKACSVLANLSVKSNMVVTADEIDAIVMAMRIHPCSCELCESACLALWNYSVLPCNVQPLRSSYHMRSVVAQAANSFPSECGQNVQELFDALGP